MTRTTAADRRNRSQAFARLLLSLLLVIAPLFANAAGMTMTDSGTGTGTPVSAQMPCHSDDIQPMQASAAAGQVPCPHCSGDGPASQCHCCGYAAPAGLGSQTGIHPVRHPKAPRLRVSVTKPLPDSPGDRLFRPPIVHS